MTYELNLKSTYLTQLQLIPISDMSMVLEKHAQLIANPHPDSKNKKRLQGLKEPVFRIRAGDYRILYIFNDEQRWISLLKIERRSRVYDDVEEIEVATPSFDVDAIPTADEALSRAREPHAHAVLADVPEPAAFDRTIDEELMDRLNILEKHRPALRRCKTIDDLISAYLPENVRERVFDAVSSPPIDQVIDKPNLIVNDANDLIRYVKGELIEFLLRLDPDQLRYVTRSISGSGPVLIKGGPGTGKSTIAIYRVKEMLALLRKLALQPSYLENGNEQRSPRILFTTYTNALVNSTRQLLEQLLGDEARLVTVETADKVAMRVVNRCDPPLSICSDRGELRSIFGRAIARFKRDEPRISQMALDGLLKRLGSQYLLDEVEEVIVGRNLRDQAAWQQASRTGRRTALAPAARIAIWRLHELFSVELERARVTTWARMRQRAADLVESGNTAETYDAIFIDEAQDLHPNALRMLVGLCVSPDRLLLTADANQSIYGSGFNWSDVHTDLRFRGRTGVLRKNYRSTRQISEAAADYLREAGLDPERAIDLHITSGPNPTVRFVERDAEPTLIEAYFKLATRDFRFGYSACAVLVPDEHAGKRLEGSLVELGLDAVFMASRSLDLTSHAIKIIPYRSAKGLEFPIVALAGLDRAFENRAVDTDARAEFDARERRALYVAMTRAMRGLIVVAPNGSANPLFSGFSNEFWNLEPSADVSA